MSRKELKAEVIRIIDGDTIVCCWEIELLDLMAAPTIRIKGIDTPEIGQYGRRKVTEVEKVHGRQAKEFLKTWILHKEVTLTEMKRELYGRIEAVVTFGERDVAELLKTAGFEKRATY